MKILHVVDSMNPEMGGVCQAVRIIVNSIHNNYGIVSEVVSLDSPNASYIKDSQIIIHALGPVSNPWKYNSRLSFWLLDNFANFNFIIVHGLWLYHTFAVQKILKKYNINSQKVFIMPHGMLDPYFQKAKNRRIKAIRNLLYWRFIEYKLIELADGILFTSKDELLLARIPFKPYSPKIEKVVGLGIELPPAYEQEMADMFYHICPDVKGQDYILYLGRIHDKKGVDILIESYEKIMQQKDNNISIPKLVIAGPGIESKFGQLLFDRVINSHLLSDSVLFTGMLTGKAKWGAFYTCSVFILPSHQENFGISVVEALACRKGVIISNKINIWREISSEAAGIVGKDSVEGTYNSLLKWCYLSNNERIAMNDRAYRCYVEFFQAKDTADHFVNLFLSDK